MSANQYDPLFQQAGQQHDVDPDLLRAMAWQESSFNPKAVGPMTDYGQARGLMGVLDSNAKAANINASDPAQAIPWAAKYLRQALDKNGGDIDAAVMEYHGGPNQKIWGPKTQQYVSDVSNKFAKIKANAGFIPGQSPQDAAPAPAGDDPIVAALSGKSAPAATGKPSAAPANDPIMAALSGKAAPAQQAAAPAPAQPVQAPDNTSRQLGIGTRAVATGLASIPNMFGDALNTAINFGIRGVNAAHDAVTSPTMPELVTGRKPWIPYLGMPSQATQDLLTKAGLPEPQNAGERTKSAIISSMAGVAPSVGLGQALAKSASPMAAAVGNSLAQAPGMQVMGAAGAGAGGSIAKENGVGPLGQIGASLGGALVGAAAPSAVMATGRAVTAVPRGVMNAVKPVTAPQQYVGEQLAQALGPEAKAIAANIRNAPEFVPGTMPTTAQVGQNPILVATEKAAANASPEFKVALAAREAANNAARWDALNAVAQTPDALSAALAARAAAAKPLYDAAHGQTANVGPAFMRYAQIPEMQEAMARANKLADLNAATGRGVAPVWPTPDSKAINGSALDYTSRALGDMINEAKRAGANTRAGALAALKESVDNWTQRYIPGVQQADAAYAAGSLPVNTMEAGQQIANQLGTRALDVNGLPQLQLNAYRAALVKALNEQKHGVDAEALKKLQGIGQDLQRGTISNALRTPGSDTAYNIAANGWLARQLYGKDFEGASMLGRGLGALGATISGHPMGGVAVLAGGKKLGQAVGTNLNNNLQELLLNPELILPYLEAATPKNTPQTLGQLLRRNVNQGAVGAVTTLPAPKNQGTK